MAELSGPGRRGRLLEGTLRLLGLALLAGLVGVAGGYGALAFLLGIELVQDTVYGLPLGEHLSVAALEPWRLVLGITAGGALVAFLLARLAPGGRAEGPADAVLAVLVRDGRMSTRWLCEPGDTEPELELRFPRSVEVKRVLLSHPWTNRFEVENQGRKARAGKVAILLDRDPEAIVVAMDPSPYRKTIVVLPEPRKVSRVRIRILEVVDGELGKAPIGFSEVELQR